MSAARTFCRVGLLIVALALAVLGALCGNAGAFWTGAGLWTLALVLFIAACWLAVDAHLDAIENDWQDAE